MFTIVFQSIDFLSLRSFIDVKIGVHHLVPAHGIERFRVLEEPEL